MHLHFYIVANVEGQPTNITNNHAMCSCVGPLQCKGQHKQHCSQKHGEELTAQLFQPKGHHNRSTNSNSITFANFQSKDQTKQKYKQHNYCLETSTPTKSKVQFCTNMKVSSSSMSQQELLDFLMYLKQDMRPSVSSELLEKLGHIESLSTPAEGETCRYMTDTITANLYPEDADRSLGPVKVYGDGNCLYRSASLLVCGNEVFILSCVCEQPLNYVIMSNTMHMLSCNMPEVV